ncbi:MAG: hypothetical protein AAGC73_04695 [Verrucomicrobiota bacterium]
MSHRLQDIEFPALVLDTSNPTIFCGLLQGPEAWLAQVRREGVALENLFPVVSQTFAQSRSKLANIESFIYCEGPGSVLGLRLAAMALQTWQELAAQTPKFYAYNGLQMTAQALQKQTNCSDALLISDWKKNAWNAAYIEAGIIRANDVVDDSALEDYPHPVYHLPQRKGWQKPPPQATTLSYDPAALINLSSLEGLLRATDRVELAQTAANTFAKWTPERHRAPQANTPAT